jgi:hypothetical protein
MASAAGRGYIAGKYSDAGSRVRDGNGGSSVDAPSQESGRCKTLPGTLRTDRVAIAVVDGGVMRVELRNGDSPAGAARFSEKLDAFRCVSGAIELTRADVAAE